MTVVRQPDQILPYCILHIKQNKIVAAGAKSKERLANLSKKNDPATTSNIINIVDEWKL